MVLKELGLGAGLVAGAFGVKSTYDLAKYRNKRNQLHIIKKPKECLKQTMIHELCHFYEWNHGPKFKALMTQYCPDWREIKEKNNL